jgi:hypothetical protein
MVLRLFPARSAILPMTGMKTGQGGVESELKPANGSKVRLDGCPQRSDSSRNQFITFFPCIAFQNAVFCLIVNFTAWFRHVTRMEVNHKTLKSAPQ